LIEPTEDHLFWAEECSKLFGGMDIFAIDALHGTDGKDYIIELNDCAIGILTEVWEEDSMTMVQMALDKMNANLSPSEKKKKAKSAKSKDTKKKEEKGEKEEKKESKKKKGTKSKAK